MKEKEIVLSYKDLYFEDEKQYLKDFTSILVEEGKITKKEAEKIKDRRDLMDFGIDINLANNEYEEYLSLQKELQRNNFKEEFKKIFKGGVFIDDEMYNFSDWEDFIEFVTNYGYISIDIYKNGIINFTYTTDTSTKTKKLIPINLLTKTEIKNIIESIDDVEYIKEKARDYFGKLYSKLNKNELIELIEYYYI